MREGSPVANADVVSRTDRTWISSVTASSRSALLVMVLAIFGSAGCSDQAPTAADQPKKSAENWRSKFNLQALGEIPYPANNPPRQERISLGRFLFFDPILGGEKDVSCGTCHHPDFAFADRRQFGAGVSGAGVGPDRILTDESFHLEPRNSQTILNVAFNGERNADPSANGCQFWDCRVNSLEAQATKPVASRVEMRGDAYPADVALDSVLDRLRGIPEYVQRFEQAYPDVAAATPDSLRSTVIDTSTYARALAAYQRELVTRNAPYDRYVRGDDEALTSEEKKGLKLFFEKANCSECHRGAMLSNFNFVVHGTPQEGVGKEVIEGDDTGREEATGDPEDRYEFRVPTLRNVEITPPYMHDGVFRTLEEVVRFYNQGARPRHEKIATDELHPALREPLDLTEEEIDALVAFMKALTDRGRELPDYLTTVPEEVPSGLTPVNGVGAQK